MPEGTVTRPVGLQGITQSVRIADIRTRLEEGNRPSKGDAKELFAELDATRAKSDSWMSKADELLAENLELRRAAKLYYRADGTAVECENPEHVVMARKMAAMRLERLRPLVKTMVENPHFDIYIDPRDAKWALDESGEAL